MVQSLNKSHRDMTKGVCDNTLIAMASRGAGTKQAIWTNQCRSHEKIVHCVRTHEGERSGGPHLTETMKRLDIM